MPSARSLTLAFLLTMVFGMQSEAAGTRWWLWSRAWQVPEVTVEEVAPAPAMLGTNQETTVLYAVQGYWTPLTQVPAGILLYTAPTPLSAYFATSPLESPGITAPAAALTPAASVPRYDAFINLTEGPYAGESLLTTGGARPWYTSPVVQQLYGGVPNAEQRAEFSSTVLDRVEQAFQRSGITNIDLTSSPADSAAHSLSVVSGTEYGPNPSAIGITNMGGDGFSFIDKLVYANSIDELQWAVAHNVAHELIHAFGVEHHDTTGRFLDAATAPWEVLVDPKTVFGPEAVDALIASNLGQDYGASSILGAQHTHGPQCQCLVKAMGVSPSPVPEPTTLLLWLIGAGVSGAHVSRRMRSSH